MKVRLNLQAIRTAEHLLKKPFSQFDLSDEETVVTLIYTTVSENNDENYTLSTFKQLLKNKKIGSDISTKFRREMEYIAQFQGEGEKGDDMYMGELATFLIMSGMNPEFVLYKMRLFEMADYIKAIEENKKEDMEKDRFWTYLNILPHVNGKKLKSPQSLIKFPWENKEVDLDKGIEIFEKFLKSKPL